MKPLTRYEHEAESWGCHGCDSRMVEAADGDWYAKAEADAVIRELEAEIEAARADAERYRWLRVCDARGEAAIMTEPTGRELKMGAELDAAIDAARKEGGE